MAGFQSGLVSYLGAALHVPQADRVLAAPRGCREPRGRRPEWIARGRAGGPTTCDGGTRDPAQPHDDAREDSQGHRWAIASHDTERTRYPAHASGWPGAA